MKLRYVVTIEDVVALNQFHQRHSPTVRRAKAAYRWLPVLLFLLPSAFGVVLGNEVLVIVGLIVGLAMVAAWLPAAPKLIRWQMDRNVRRMYAEGRNQGTLGSHELELTAGELIHRTSLSETRVRYPMIERIETDGGYTFIYVSALSALTIPHAAVTDGDPEAFTAALRQKLADTAPAGEKSSSAAAV